MAVTSADMSLKIKLGYSAIGTIGVQAINLLGFILLARILSPYEIGLMTMVAIFTSLSSIFVEMGLGASLIHQQELSEAHRSTVFWMNFCMGLLLAFGLFVSSGLVASFFNNPNLNELVNVIAWTIPLSAMSVVPYTLMQKNHEFKKISLLNIAATTASIVVAIGFAWHGFGVWSLVISVYVLAIMRLAGGFLFERWRPKLEFSRRVLLELWGYSSYLFGTSIINYIIANIDKILIGRCLGAGTLGYYKYAYQIAGLPGNLVGAIFTPVYFSSYASFKDDKDRIKEMHFRAVRMIAFVVFPVMLILASISDIFVLSIFGEKWFGMAHILSYLCIALLLEAVGTMSGPLFLSQGKTKELFWLNIAIRVVNIVGMVIGIQHGIDGLLWGLIIARLVIFYPLYRVVGRTVGFSVRELMINLTPPFFISIISVASLLFIKHNFIVSFDSLNTLILFIVLGLSLYSSFSIFFQRDRFLEVWHAIKR